LTIHYGSAESPYTGDTQEKNVRDVDTLVNPAIDLGNEPSGIVDEIVHESRKEEISSNNSLGHCQFLLSLIEIKVDKEIFEETRDGIRVLVLFHPDNLDELLDVISIVPLTGGFWCSSRNDGGGDKVSKEMGT
jgi:hypothetical protein